MTLVSNAARGGTSSGGLTSLFTNVLTVAANSLDSGAGGFSSAFSVLYVFAYLRGTQAANTVNAQITLNNDTGANYDYMVSGGQNATPNAGNSIGGTAWLPAAIAGSGSAGSFSAFSIVIPAYAGTTGRKSAVMTTGVPDPTAANMIVQTFQAQYRSTTAVTRVTITPSAGQWAIGSALYVAAL